VATDRERERDERVEGLRNDGKRLTRTKSGDDWELEELAAHLLAKSRKGVTSHSDLRDFLTQSQLDLRRSREVMPTQGFPEAHLFSGLYRRAYNPLTRGPHSSNATPNLDGEPNE
jgi:hypothetical protein